MRITKKYSDPKQQAAWEAGVRAGFSDAQVMIAACNENFLNEICEFLENGEDYEELNAKTNADLCELLKLKFKKGHKVSNAVPSEKST